MLTVPPYPSVLEDPAPRFFSLATRDPPTGGSQKPFTLTARMTFESRWYSTAPSKTWTCPVLVQWESWMCRSIIIHTNAHPLRGPSLGCAGSHALDALVSPRQRYTNHPMRALQGSAQPIPIRPCGHSQGVRQERKQHIRGEPMAVTEPMAVAGKASSEGSVSN